MKEIEARFLEIDVQAMEIKLKELGARDLGDDFFEEIIFYDKDLEWQKDGRIHVRLRKTKNGTFMSYKDARDETLSGTKEIEVKVDDFNSARSLLEAAGLVAYRIQEKKRRSFVLDGVKIDIDQWPAIPPYVEIEGRSEEAVREMAKRLGFSWDRAIFGNAGATIGKYYNIPIKHLRHFTFSKVE